MSADDYTYDPQESLINDARIFTIVLATISLLFPLSVVIILIQKYKTLVVGKSLIHYILMIAIADTMTAFFISFGYPSSYDLCAAQGFGLVFFSRMSWLYTDVLIFQLFYVVVFKRFLNKRYMDALVFALNIALSLAPLSTGSRYGIRYIYKSMGTCSINDGGGGRWLFYAIQLEMYISFIMIIILAAIIVCYSLFFNTNKSSNIYINERIKDSWKVVILYPLAMMVTWLPGQVYAFYNNGYYHENKKEPKNGLVIYDYLFAFSVLYGPLLSIIFYTKTLDARRAWMHNLRFIMYVATSIDIDDRTTCGSIISIDDGRVSEIDQSSLNHSTWLRVTNLISTLWKGDNNEMNTEQQISRNNQSINPMLNNSSAVVRIGEEL